jgi:hypothetical protein
MMPKRRIFLIDKRFQLRLATRLIGYWVFMWSLVFGLPIVMVFGYQLVATRLPVYELFTGIISDFWFPVVMSLLVAPIVIRDSIRFSHRVAGPLFRLHRDLGLFLDGKPVQAIRLREGDFCHDLATNLNRVFEEFERKKDQAVSSEGAICDRSPALPARAMPVVFGSESTFETNPTSQVVR